ncbi:ALI_HP2_G0033670.mRNA.1.CDS.1 [Saccharomyces cerevisiae]|nr:ALI_HP2_G0033670.mRNA.1.CDS.1 [Saccharomyces cerevisiae]CAI6557946.1 ALI_HP2_G0033670.mRNA.1.CDS.1 [Saccharomyces cerevisiae]
MSKASSAVSISGASTLVTNISSGGPYCSFIISSNDGKFRTHPHGFCKAPSPDWRDLEFLHS